MEINRDIIILYSRFFLFFLPRITPAQRFRPNLSYCNYYLSAAWKLSICICYVIHCGTQQPRRPSQFLYMYQVWILLMYRLRLQLSILQRSYCYINVQVYLQMFNLTLRVESSFIHLPTSKNAHWKLFIKEPRLCLWLIPKHISSAVPSIKNSLIPRTFPLITITSVCLNTWFYSLVKIVLCRHCYLRQEVIFLCSNQGTYISSLIDTNFDSSYIWSSPSIDNRSIRLFYTSKYKCINRY